MTARAERTRAAILDAAEAVFAEQGFAATRLGEVAERVGIRRASIVYYFRDKTELYDAVLGEVFGGLRESLEGALLGRGTLRSASRGPSRPGWTTWGLGPPWRACCCVKSPTPGPARRRPCCDTQGPSPRWRSLPRRASPTVPWGDVSVDPAHLASIIAGATVFLLVGMPILAPDLPFDPLSSTALDAHRQEVLRVTRRLLDTPATGSSGRATTRGARRG